MTRLVEAIDVAKVLWPEFVVDGDAVFLGNERERAPQPLDSFSDELEAECFVNHVHVLNMFEHNAALDGEPFWDRTAPDFCRAVELAIIIAETWASKLAREFPDMDFAVYATRDDNPIIRFHKIRVDGALWTDVTSPEQIASGAGIMIRVQQGRVLETVGKLVNI